MMTHFINKHHLAEKVINNMFLRLTLAKNWSMGTGISFTVITITMQG